jgi:hypothetical protein
MQDSPATQWDIWANRLLSSNAGSPNSIWEEPARSIESPFLKKENVCSWQNFLGLPGQSEHRRCALLHGIMAPIAAS